jgi:hypothetical protein
MIRRAGLATLLAAATVAAGASAEPVPWRRTETRADCADFDPLRQPLFGDLHVHTSLSHDAYLRFTRVGPRDAYAFARGAPVLLPDEAGNPTRSVTIDRPLDFTAVTDHAEFFGEVLLCTTDSSPAYGDPLCVAARTLSDPATERSEFLNWSVPLGLPDPPPGQPFCTLPGVDCDTAAVSVWGDIQAAAEEAYDRSSACEFTTLIGYEHSAAPGGSHLHRNVIFRNANVPAFATSYLETGQDGAPQPLWTALEHDCIDAGTGCEVLTIPHNSNLSGGKRWPDPIDVEDARRRQQREPLVEIFQHKTSSECHFDRTVGLGADTADELCAFERDPRDRQLPIVPPVESYPRRNMVRNVLKDGLAIERTLGVNPFRFGIIASTDTHTGTPGATAERGWQGARGVVDATDETRIAGGSFAEVPLRYNPGGLAVVWAEERSRDAIFAALARRETYGTSGTRPIVRFFAGALDGVDCGSPTLVADAYRTGVPMGGELGPDARGRPPRFLVWAQKDPAGVDLQRVQIVKGWLDASGTPRETVVDVAGDAENGAGVDEATCAPTGSGAAELCTVWEDPDFDPTTESFYYVRVLENPTCRWHAWACKAAGVDPFAADCLDQAAAHGGAPWDQCCDGQDPWVTPVIQERAWTSPVWYRPRGIVAVRGALKRGRRPGHDVIKLAATVGELPIVADPTTSGARFAFGEHWVVDVPPAAWRKTRRGWRTIRDVPGLRKAIIRRKRTGRAVIKVRSAPTDLSAVEQTEQIAEVHVDVGPWSATHARRWQTFRRGLRPPR